MHVAAAAAVAVVAVSAAGTLAAIGAGMPAAIGAGMPATDTEGMDTEDTRTTDTGMGIMGMGAGSQGHTGVSFTSAIIEAIRTKRLAERRVFCVFAVDPIPDRAHVACVRSRRIALQLA
jgi:hypothetical protein